MVNSVLRARPQLAKRFQVWFLFDYFLEGQCMCDEWKFEGNDRSVILLGVLGCTRATLMHSTSFINLA